MNLKSFFILGTIWLAPLPAAGENCQLMGEGWAMNDKGMCENTSPERHSEPCEELGRDFELTDDGGCKEVGRDVWTNNGDRVYALMEDQQALRLACGQMAGAMNIRSGYCEVRGKMRVNLRAFQLIAKQKEKKEREAAQAAQEKLFPRATWRDGQDHLEAQKLAVIKRLNDDLARPYNCRGDAACQERDVEERELMRQQIEALQE